MIPSSMHERNTQHHPHHAFHHPYQQQQNQNQNHTNIPTTTGKCISTRTKCDQVIYEAVAKAAEVIVRGRCQVHPTSSSTSNTTVTSNTKNSSGGVRGTSGLNTGGGGAIARFNLEVEEVESVRSVLQMWKKSLHIPLRLDVYYQYCTDVTQPERTTRKELLERWCVDYISCSSDQQQKQYQKHLNNNQSTKGGTAICATDESIVQLRLVCKRLVIFLRTLHCFTRIMPSFRLHQALLLEEGFIGGAGVGLEDMNYGVGGGVGYSPNGNDIGGGFYSQNNGHYQHKVNKNRHSQQQQNRDRDLLGGKILFSFHVSEARSGNGEGEGEITIPLQQQQTPSQPNNSNNNNKNGSCNSSNCKKPDLTHDLASSSNGPFVRHDLHPVPTPYGCLHVTALYDSILCVGGVLEQRAQRLAIFQCVGSGSTRAIPILREPRMVLNGVNDDNRGDTLQRRASHPSPMQYPQDQHAQPQALIRPASLQHTPPSANAISLCQSKSTSTTPIRKGQQPLDTLNFIQDYASGATTTIFNNIPIIPTTEELEAKNSDTTAFTTLQGNDKKNDDVILPPTAGDIGGIGERKRAVSGLSLALMNIEQQQRKEAEKEQQQEIPSSPIIAYSKAGDDVASQRRQRLAFHHPPPSFTGSNNNTIDHIPSSLLQQKQSGATSTSPCLMNCGNGSPGVVVPTPYMMGMSPIATVHTPPQPVFIGSLPRGVTNTPGGVGPTLNIGSALQYSSSTENEKHHHHHQHHHQQQQQHPSTKLNVSNGEHGEVSASSPPFRNPLTLQQFPEGQALGMITTGDDGGGGGGVDDVCHSMAGGSLAVDHSKSAGGMGGRRNIDDKDVLLPPLTSLDILANNPFKGLGIGTNFNCSAASSLSLGMGSAAYYGPYEDLASAGVGAGVTSSRSCLPPTGTGGEYLFRSSVGGGVGACSGVFAESKNDGQENSDYENMPFAVDMDYCTTAVMINNKETTSERIGGGVGDLPLEGSAMPDNSKVMSKSNSTFDNMGSSIGKSSQVIASLAHRCATAERLKLFTDDSNCAAKNESMTLDTTKLVNLDGNGLKKSKLDESVASLASKLAEFHNFDNSLRASGLMTTSLSSGGRGGGG